MVCTKAVTMEVSIFCEPVCILKTRLGQDLCAFRGKSNKTIAKRLGIITKIECLALRFTNLFGQFIFKMFVLFYF